MADALESPGYNPCLRRNTCPSQMHAGFSER
jgi:hypothetical protein